MVAGDVVINRYEGPKGGLSMQEMLYPTYLKAKGLGKECELITDDHFSGGTSGLSIGHFASEAASGGGIGLVEEGVLLSILASKPYKYAARRWMRVKNHGNLYLVCVKSHLPLKLMPC